MAHATAPDVVVLDLMLPGIDAAEPCPQLRTFTDAARAPAACAWVTTYAAAASWSRESSPCHLFQAEAKAGSHLSRTAVTTMCVGSHDRIDQHRSRHLKGFVVCRLTVSQAPFGDLQEDRLIRIVEAHL